MENAGGGTTINTGSFSYTNISAIYVERGLGESVNHILAAFDSTFTGSMTNCYICMPFKMWYSIGSTSYYKWRFYRFKTPYSGTGGYVFPSAPASSTAYSGTITYYYV